MLVVLSWVVPIQDTLSLLPLIQYRPHQQLLQHLLILQVHQLLVSILTSKFIPHLSINPSIYPFIQPLIHISINISLHLSIHPFSLSIHPFINPFILHSSGVNPSRNFSSNHYRSSIRGWSYYFDNINNHICLLLLLLSKKNRSHD